MERCFNKGESANGSINADYNRIILSDRDKRFNIVTE
jgi:hypothetical protein